MSPATRQQRSAESGELGLEGRLSPALDSAGRMLARGWFIHSFVVPSFISASILSFTRGHYCSGTFLGRDPRTPVAWAPAERGGRGCLDRQRRDEAGPASGALSPPPGKLNREEELRREHSNTALPADPRTLDVMRAPQAANAYAPLGTAGGVAPSLPSASLPSASPLYLLSSGFSPGHPSQAVTGGVLPKTFGDFPLPTELSSPPSLRRLPPT